MVNLLQNTWLKTSSRVYLGLIHKALFTAAGNSATVEIRPSAQISGSQNRDEQNALNVEVKQVQAPNHIKIVPNTHI